MGKQSRVRILSDTEAKAISRNLRVSVQKLNLVSSIIRGKNVDKALSDLTFSKRRISIDVKKCLQSAIANAENNHNLDIDNLFVKEIFVGKSFVMKRMRARARGRSGKILKPFANVTIIVAEKKES